MVKQIPDSKLRKYPVPISETILPYVKQKCQVGYDRLDTILIIQSPAVNITASTINATKNVTKLNNYLTLQLYTVIPKGANVSNDFCLGKVDDVTLVWKCYSRDLKNITDGRFIYFTKEMGAYAVLFSPLYATSDSTWTGGVYVLWFAEHPRLAALYVLVLFLLVVFIALSLWCVSIQMKEYNRTARELNDYQNALRENLGPTETNARASEESEEAGNMLDGEPHKRFLQMKEEIQSLRAELAHFKTTSREEEKQ